MAAAIGASLPIHEPLGNMIVDIGGGTSEVAVISLGGVVALEAVRVGSFDIDAAIQSYVRREYGLAIGERTAEEVKLAIGSVFPTDDEYKAEVRGRDLMSGMPKVIVLTPEEIREAIDEPIQQILGAVKAALAHTARAVAGPPGRGHPPGRWRRDVARVRSPDREGDGRPRSSSTSPSRRSCSAPVAASRASTASKTCSCSSNARARGPLASDKNSDALVGRVVGGAGDSPGRAGRQGNAAEL